MRPLRGPQAVSHVVAIVVLVAITVVLTAVLYVVVLDIARQAQDVRPIIFIGDERRSTATDTSFTVLGASQALPFRNFKLKLFIDDGEDEASTSSPLASGTVGNVTFTDRDHGGTLSEGDTFLVNNEGGRAYELALFWKGSLAHSVRWDT